jgi:hypothetical protein
MRPSPLVLWFVLCGSASAGLLRERCAWTGDSLDPDVNDVIMSPVVVDLDGDGASDVVFVAYDGSDTGAGRLVAISGSDCHELFVVRAPGCQRCVSDAACRPLDADANGGFLGTIGIAAGDLDGDGRPEIVAMLHDASDYDPQRLIAFNSDGSFRWCTAAAGLPLSLFGNPFFAATPSIADLDGDGRPEIVVGARSYDADGNLIAQNVAFDELITSAIPVDLDRDGRMEIVLGAAALDADANVLWIRPDLLSTDVFGTWRTTGAAAADLDGDGFPEVVLVSLPNTSAFAPILSVLDGRSGATVSATTLVPTGPGCAPNFGIPGIGDVDGDGRSEIAISSGATLCLYDQGPAGVVQRWCAAIDDCTSGWLSPSFADVNGDGRDEVLLRDQDAFRVYDGAGGVLADIPCSSTTGRESVVAAEVDGDCAGELIVTADDILPGSNHGVRIFEGDDAPLPPSRAIWNQNAYHVTNVNDDGSIPRSEVSTTSFRAQAEASPRAGDLVASMTTLWPPNHRMVRVDLRDPNGASVHVRGVFQDEPLDDRGDGHFEPDAVIGSDFVLLRAERDGRADGRVYHVEASTGSGACETVSIVTICVPHDRRPSRRGAGACGDGGALYDSTGR